MAWVGQAVIILPVLVPGVDVPAAAPSDEAADVCRNRAPLARSAEEAAASGGFLSLGDLAFVRSDLFWWHALVTPALRARVAQHSDIHWRIPASNADVTLHCLSLISALDACWYIGITEQVCLRWEAHARNGYVAMYIVRVSTTSRDTSRLEMDVLFRIGRSLRCENASRGGERASQGNPHFAYVVVRPNALTRRSFGPRGGRSRMGGGTVMDDLYGTGWERR